MEAGSFRIGAWPRRGISVKKTENSHFKTPISAAVSMQQRSPWNGFTLSIPYLNPEGVDRILTSDPRASSTQQPAAERPRPDAFYTTISMDPSLSLSMPILNISLTESPSRSSAVTVNSNSKSGMSALLRVSISAILTPLFEFWNSMTT